MKIPTSNVNFDFDAICPSICAKKCILHGMTNMFPFNRMRNSRLQISVSPSALMQKIARNLAVVHPKSRVLCTHYICVMRTINSNWRQCSIEPFCCCCIDVLSMPPIYHTLYFGYATIRSVNKNDDKRWLCLTYALADGLFVRIFGDLMISLCVEHAERHERNRNEPVYWNWQRNSKTNPFFSLQYVAMISTFCQQYY